MDDNQKNNQPEEVSSGVDSDQANNNLSEVNDSADSKSSDPIYLNSAEYKKSKLSFSKKKLIIIIALVLVLVGGGAGAYLLTKKEEPKNSNQASTSSTESKEQSKEVAKDLDPELKKFIEPTTGETWLASPKAVENLGFFQADYPLDEKYYEVGSRAGNTIYMTVYYQIGSVTNLFEKGSDGKVRAIMRPDALAVYNDDDEQYDIANIKDTVTIDKETKYDSLSIPNKITLANGYVLKKTNNGYLGMPIDPASDTESKAKIEDIETFGESKLQKISYTDVDTSLTSIGYSISLPIKNRVGLGYEPMETNLADFKFSTGSSYERDTLSAITRGCGSRTTSVSRADKVTDADVIEVGKTGSGLGIFELKDANHSLVTKAYDEFKEFYKEDPTNQYRNITKEEFIKYHAIVLHKDKNNEWLVYTRDQLRPAAGCAKPVVYLYPTQQTMVNVKVGADVKISDPLYNPTTGWNALASPSGNLIVNGLQYDSLFWEGPGIGQYPAITEGVVVPTSSAISTIRYQLIQQGLNQKEINDFVEYWEPNLPNKPYIRLTWLNTKQLDVLAPLQISPKPDTVIRVFLDFAGMDEPMDLPAQQFEALPRTGFTVVEWGGLSAKKLY